MSRPEKIQKVNFKASALTLKMSTRVRQRWLLNLKWQKSWKISSSQHHFQPKPNTYLIFRSPDDISGCRNPTQFPNLHTVIPKTARLRNFSFSHGFGRESGGDRREEKGGDSWAHTVSQIIVDSFLFLCLLFTLIFAALFSCFSREPIHFQSNFSSLSMQDCL